MVITVLVRGSPVKRRANRHESLHPKTDAAAVITTNTLEEDLPDETALAMSQECRCRKRIAIPQVFHTVAQIGEKLG